jgi:hypothetical protein
VNLTSMPKLSPAAQAVLDALSLEELNGPQQLMARAHAAAALQAVADQVAPEPDDWVQDYFSILELQLRCGMRDQILAIVAELETQ